LREGQELNDFGNGDGSMISMGMNNSQMHDSSACIVRDGEVLFAVAEERLSGVKHDAGFPALAIRACLEFVRGLAERPESP
jgi:predicted NodU family carbamoyl transferase